MRKNKKEGFTMMDLVVGGSILSLSLTIMLSASSLMGKIEKENSVSFEEYITIKDHVETVASEPDWSNLDNQTREISDNIDVSYQISKTQWNTEKLIFVFNNGKTFSVERGGLSD